MTACTKSIIRFGILISLVSAQASAAERPGKAFDLSPWKVGDKWVVHLNVRVHHPEVSRGDRDDVAEWLERMREEWKVKGKPKGESFGEWLEKVDARPPKKHVPVPRAVHVNPPYEDWMLCDWRCPDPLYGPYYARWAAWHFEVVAEKKVLGRRCFAVRATMQGWVDSAGKPAPSEEQKKIEKFVPRWQLHLFFSAADRSLVKLKLSRKGGADYIEQPGGGVPVISLQVDRPGQISTLPAYFPALPLWSHDRCKLIKDGKVKRPGLPLGAVSQKCRLLPDGRILVTMSHDMESAGKDPHTEYGKFFFTKGLPWWTEAYVFSRGGLRARLFSVNGKKVSTRLKAELVLAVLLDAAPAKLVFRLKNTGKQSLATTPLGIDANLVIITTPKGKRIRSFVNKSGVTCGNTCGNRCASKCGKRSIVVEPGKSKVWEAELGAIFRRHKLSEDGLYRFSWEVEGVASNEILFVKKPAARKGKAASSK